MARFPHSVPVLVLLAVCSAGCPSRARVEPAAANMVEMDGLAKQLGLKVSRAPRSGMVVMSGPRGTVVFNPRISGIVVGNEVLFKGHRTTISGNLISVPANFIEECERKLRPAIVRDTGPVLPSSKQPSFRVVIDPGHGGHDPGALGASRAPEKMVNLSVARLAASKLQGAGVDVIMTRSGDSFIELNERAAIGNRANADAFVAIHSDASVNRGTTGFTIFVVASKYSELERAQDIADECALSGSRLLSALAANRARSGRLASYIQSQMAAVAASPDRGIQPGELRVLKRSLAPAVLIELGFMSNPAEEQLLLRQDYQEQLATAIARGVLLFLNAK